MLCCALLICSVLHIVMQVLAMNDLQEQQQVNLVIRLLSLADTAAQCGDQVLPVSRGTDIVALATATYARYSHTVTAVAAAAAATELWSSTEQQLLAEAGQGCSPSTCYVHLVLAAEGQSNQETTVWLAPFKALALQEPHLQVSGFKLTSQWQVIGNAQPQGLLNEVEARNTAMAAAAGEGKKGGAGAGSSMRMSYLPLRDEVAFTVLSEAVAVYAVWEMGMQLPGHFSDNALMVHPCEPRQVAFLASTAMRQGHADNAGASLHIDANAKSSSSSSRGGAAAYGSRAFGSNQARVVASGTQLVELLQAQLVVSSLWDHQAQPDGPAPELLAAA